MSRTSCNSLLPKILLLGLASGLAPLTARAEDPKTHTVKAGPWRIELKIPGVVESTEIKEVAVRPKVFTSLIVQKAVPQGKQVKAGEQLLWLEMEKIDDELKELSFQLTQTRLSQKQAEIELTGLEKTVPIDLDAASREKKNSDDDLVYYREVAEPRSRRDAEEALKAAKYNFEYITEELKQLEKMYKADDLTEESEEIILRRARRDSEHAKLAADEAQIRYDRQLKTEIPRDMIKKTELNRREEIALLKARVALPISLEQKKIEVKKLAHAMTELEEKLTKLQADREAMTLTAPVAGLVAYGQCERGKFTTAEALRTALRPGGTISPHQIVMTIIPEGPAVMRLDVPEANLSLCVAGTKGYAVLASTPGKRIPATLLTVSNLPVKDSVHDGTVDFKAKNLSIGSTCTVHLQVYHQPKAITVPAGSVWSDQEDLTNLYVFVSVEGKPTRRPVKTGITYDDKTEILEGLAEGDAVLLERQE